jgi:signal-transduction protein with cAMP-binding, CBS, and nucleotidyltransferase domain
MSHVPEDISALLSTPIEHFINTNIAILESDRYTDEALGLMKDKGVRSVLASRLGEVVGIVSKTDILFKVMSQGRNPGKVRLREIMTSPVLAVAPHNTVQETLSIMDRHVVRQVIVSSHSAVLGMVSRDDIFEKMHLAVSSAKLVCPYCESPFDTKEGLSSHIDRLHSGTGVLEGDVRRMFE